MRTLSLSLLALLTLPACGLLNGDLDGDGISNDDERAAGTDPRESDTDGDGIDDPDEADLGTDPTQADSDGDGLDDGAELELGSDPLVEDTDEDGLLDGAEADAGTDPTDPDTDGDGYLDPHELDEGSDPTDPESRIYAGGWPYNPDKDDWGEPNSVRARAGAEVPRFRLEDQFGDTFDVYEFADSGDPLFLDLTGLWCGWCHELAKRMEGKPSALDNQRGLDCLQDAIPAGTIDFITIIYSDRTGQPGTGTRAAVDAWYSQHTNPHVPVLADPDSEAYRWFQAQGFPAVIRVNTETMTAVHAPGNPSYVGSLSGACAEVGN